MTTASVIGRQPITSQPSEGMPGMAKDTATATDEQPKGAPYGYKADGTPRKRPGRPANGESKPKLIKSVAQIRVMSASDLGITEEEAQQAATKQTGAVAQERSEMAVYIDGQITSALAEWTEAGEPADVPGSRIVKFLAGESVDECEELRRLVYNSQRYLRKNGIPNLKVRTFALSQHVSGGYLLPWSVSLSPDEQDLQVSSDE